MLFRYVRLLVIGLCNEVQKKEAILSNPLESEERSCYESQKEDANSLLTLFFLKEEGHVMGTLGYHSFFERNPS